MSDIQQTPGPFAIGIPWVLLLLTGCCGPLEADRARLDLPVLHKALDHTHEILASRGEKVLHAGAASVDITTRFAREEGIFLGGFDLGRRNVAVRDPVYAHALYLDDGNEPLVLVTLDTIGLQNDHVREVRELASDRHRDRIVVAATHNHVGPDTVGLWGPSVMGLPACTGLVPEYMETLKYLLAEVVDRAVRSAVPARIRVASGPVNPELSVNIHPAVRFQKDDTVRVMAVESAVDGGNIAVVANWGCHAEALWNDDQLSADWPGAFYRRWISEVGGVPLFIQGALGGLVTVSPGHEKLKLEDDIMDVFLDHVSVPERLLLAEKVGEGLYDAVRGVLDDAGETFGPEDVTLAVETEETHLIIDNLVLEYLGKRGLLQRRTSRRNFRHYVFTDVLAARIRHGDRVLADLVTVPGEPTPPLVEELDATSEAPVKFTVSLGNDEVGYLLREQDWDLDIYRYERTMSLGPGTGTRLLDLIGEMRKWL